MTNGDDETEPEEDAQAPAEDGETGAEEAPSEANAEAEADEATAEAADEEGGDPEDAAAEAEGDESEEEETAETQADEADETAVEAADEDEDEGEVGEAVTQESLEERLSAAEADIDEAETEDDLDEVEAELDAIEADLESADLPEPEDEDEDDPREEVESRLEEVRGALEEARGPYAEDVVEDVEAAKTKIEEGEWTDQGEREVAETVHAFLDDVSEPLDDSFSAASDDLGDLQTALDDVAESVESADLDADEDAETIATLLEATDDLLAGLEAAQEWDDLTVVEKLRAQEFYDRLEPQNRKDYPPELSVVRIAEAENDPERVLMAMDYLTSDFMQENCVEALKRMGAPEAYDPMMQKAQKRDFDAIQVLGKIGNPDALETLHDYIEGDSNLPLQKVTLKAIGEIGDESSVQPVADRLAADDPEIRSVAARSLGLLGDTRAIDPLSDVLAEDDDDSVRTSAAWALNSIGTERALETAAEYADDRSYILQTEAERAEEALADEESGEPAAEPTA